MRTFWIVCGVILGLCQEANSRHFNRTAVAGQPTAMTHYYTWFPDCRSSSGAVRVITKPRYGRLSHTLVDRAIEASRVVGIDRCYGRPIKALLVTYTPNRGFVGTDSFALDLTFRRLRETIRLTSESIDGAISRAAIQRSIALSLIILQTSPAFAADANGGRMRSASAADRCASSEESWLPTGWATSAPSSRRASVARR